MELSTDFLNRDNGNGGILPSCDYVFRTTEMHTGGDPLRIVESGFDFPTGFKDQTIQEKVRFVKKNRGFHRQIVMHEPRGHSSMYGALLMETSLPGAHLATMFLQTDGIASMCGHGVIALGRYAVDRGLVDATEGETEVGIECPCGLVKAYVAVEKGRPGKVRFYSVPAFAYALGVKVAVAGHGEVVLDIGYGGAFYAILPAAAVGLDIHASSTADIVEAATRVTDAVRKSGVIEHPEDPDLSFLCGTILTDGNDEWSDQPTYNSMIYGDRACCRAPCGSGVTARAAIQFSRGQIKVGQTRTCASGRTGSSFQATVTRETRVGKYPAIVVEVSGRAHYTGAATYVVETDDPLKSFLLK